MEKITKINGLLDQLIELKTQDRDSTSVIVGKRRKYVIGKPMRLTVNGPFSWQREMG